MLILRVGAIEVTETYNGHNSFSSFIPLEDTKPPISRVANLHDWRFTNYPLLASITLGGSQPMPLEGRRSELAKAGIKSFISPPHLYL